MPTFPSPTSGFLTVKSLTLVNTGSSNFQVNITQLFHTNTLNFMKQSNISMTKIAKKSFIFIRRSES